MFGPPIRTLAPVEVEHTSPMGSGSLITVNPPLPSPIQSLEGPFSVSTMPSVCPLTRLRAPGYEGPKVVP